MSDYQREERKSVDTSESASMRQEDAPVDGTDQPRAAGDDLGPFNYDPDEIEVATEEQLQRVIEEEGKLREPEIPACRSTLSYHGARSAYSIGQSKPNPSRVFGLKS